MDNCEHCNELLLDYLFELLDEGEADAVRGHLSACPSCRDQLAQAEHQQQLIAHAARLYQNVPPFVPPVITPAQPSSAAETVSLCTETFVDLPPTVAAAPAARSRRGAWGWLSLAASVLIVATASWGVHQYLGELHRHENAVADAGSDLATVDQQFASLVRDYEKQLDTLPTLAADEPLRLQVTGSAVVQPQTENLVFVNTTDLGGKPSAADVTVRLVEPESGKVLAEQVATEAVGPVALSLSPQRNALPGTKWRLEVEAVSNRTGARADKLVQPVTVGAARYLTQVVSSKPAYAPGELLFFRTLTLDQFSHAPAGRSFLLNYSLLDARGAVIKTLLGTTQPDGIGGGEFALSDDLADGAYLLRVDDVTPGAAQAYAFAPQSLPVLIRRSLTPNVVLEQNLAPGKKVNFDFQGGLSNANQPITVSVATKGSKSKGGKNSPPGKGDPSKQKHYEQFRADPLGNAKGSIVVPGDLPPQSDAEIAFEVHDGKLNKRFYQSVPVVNAEWRVGLFPEGGELIAGLPNRVYCDVATPGDQVEELLGEVVLGENVLGTFALRPRHRRGPSERVSGVFVLTPKAGATCSVRIRQAASTVATPKAAAPVVAQQQLPAARSGDLTMSVANPVAAAAQSVECQLHSSAADYPVLVVVTRDGQLVGQRFGVARPQGAAVTVPLAARADGVLRVTAYHATANGLTAWAQRLIYRAPEKKLNLSFAPKYKRLAHGQKAELQVECTDENDMPASANLLALVVDESSLPAKNRNASWNLPAYFYLAAPLQQTASLEGTTVLVGSDKASRDALDQFLAIEGRLAGAVGTVAHGPGAARPALFCRDDLATLQAKRRQALADSSVQLREALAQERRQAEQRRADAAERLHTASGELSDLQRQGRFYFDTAVALLQKLALLLGVVLLAVGCWRAMRLRRPAGRAFTGALAAVAVCLLLAGVYPLAEPWIVGENGPGLQAGLPSLPQLPPARQLALIDAPKPSSLPNQVVELPVHDRGDDMTKGNDVVKGPLPEKDADNKATKGDKLAENAKHLVEKASASVYWLVAEQQAKSGKDGAPGDIQLGLNELATTKRYQETLKAQTKFMQEAYSGQVPQYGSGSHPGTTPPPVPFPPKATGQNGTPTFPVWPMNGFGGGFPGQGYQYGSPDVGNFAKQFTYEKALQTQVHRPDTLLWYPDLAISGGTGKVSFDLPSYSASYRVLLIGNDASGRLGFYEGSFKAKTK